MNRGFTIIEVVIVLFVIAILFAVNSGLSHSRIQKSKADRVVNDEHEIAIALIQYYKQYNSWPAQLSDLKPEFLSSNMSLINLFGKNYSFSTNANQVSVSSLIPKDLIKLNVSGIQVTINNQGADDMITVSKPLSWGLATSARYKKKYVYNE